MKIKRYILHILILAVFIGFFVPMSGVNASVANPNEPCVYSGSGSDANAPDNPPCKDTRSAANSTIRSCDFAPNPKLQDLLRYATCIITNSLIPLIFALAVIMFIWGVVQYVINSSDEAKKEKGRQFMLWGIIALTVMVGVWGLVKILGATLGIDTTFIPKVKP